MRLVEQSDGRIRKVDDFANQLNITSKYLSTLLKETMNRRPSEMIHFYTLKAIEHRLRYTDMTMQEIANDLNFANPSFFGKYFKEHAGMTPLDRNMWFNSMIREEPYPGLNCRRTRQRCQGPSGLLWRCCMVVVSSCREVSA